MSSRPRQSGRGGDILGCGDASGIGTRKSVEGSLGTGSTAFSFKSIGSLAAIGRRTEVANVLEYDSSGFLAWWM